MTGPIEVAAQAAEYRFGMDMAAKARDDALATRLQLLEAGWGDDHRLCEDLDATATRYATWWEVYRRRLLDLTREAARP